MLEYGFTIDNEPLIYVNCTSNSKELLEQVEKAINNVLKENYPYWNDENDGI